MSWSFLTKGTASSWENIQKSEAPSFNAVQKGDILIYFVSEAGDYYLTGENEEDHLITNEGASWSFVNKN